MGRYFIFMESDDIRKHFQREVFADGFGCSYYQITDRDAIFWSYTRLLIF